MDEQQQMIEVEVAYALPDKQTILQLTVNKDSSIEQIIEQSGICELYPAIDLATDRVGIFSKLAKLTDTIVQGDRIEIYRALIADPKEVRKQRALKSKK